MTEDRNERKLENSGVIIPLSNCHSKVLSTSIAIGEPAQVFDVVIDTTSSTLWVPSIACENCEMFGVRLYDPEASSSRAQGSASDFETSLPTEDNDKTIILRGNISKDGVRIGALYLQNQEFGGISSFPEFADYYYPQCENIDGVLGLSLSSDKSIAAGIKQSFEFPVISIFYNAEIDDFPFRQRQLGNRSLDGEGEQEYNDLYDDTQAGDDDAAEKDDLFTDDDYYAEEPNMNPSPSAEAPPPPKQNMMGGGADMADDMAQNAYDDELKDKIDDFYPADASLQNNAEPEAAGRPTSAQSEMVLGGVNPKRYLGCINWHPITRSPLSSWAVTIDNFDNQVALIDTTSPLIFGPMKEVGEYLAASKAVCHTVNEQEDELGPAIPCAETPFDVAFIDCNDAQKHFLSLDFTIGTSSYDLVREDLIFEYFDDYVQKNVCQYRLVGQKENFWRFGTPFLKKHYVSFDLQKEMIGLALSAAQNNEYCDVDKPLFTIRNSEPAFHDPHVDNSPPNHKKPKNIDSSSSSISSSAIEESVAGEVDYTTGDVDASTNFIPYIVAPVVLIGFLLAAFIIRKRRIAAVLKEQRMNEIDSMPITGDDWDMYDEEEIQIT